MITMDQRDIAEIKVDAELAMLREIQRIIGNAYDPENNPDMNDLYCHLDHMAYEIADKADEEFDG